jgi:hypothetical protein
MKYRYSQYRYSTSGHCTRRRLRPANGRRIQKRKYSTSSMAFVEKVERVTDTEYDASVDRMM